MSPKLLSRLAGSFLTLVCLTAHGESPPVEWPINQAVLKKDIADLKRLLDSSDQPPRQRELNAGLAAAAGKDRILAAELLLAKGADPNAKWGPMGHTPVIIATREQNPQVLKLLLEGAGDPNVVDNMGWRPFHHAILAEKTNLDVVRVLLKYGADVNGRDGLKRTPLHRAADFGQKEAVLLLLDKGADATLREKYGRIAWERTRRSGHSGLANLLATYNQASALSE